MAKHFTVKLLLIIALVFCFSISSRAARLDASFAAVKPVHQSVNGENEVNPMDEDQLEGCEGKANEDECLMRRTMIAHVDYIYTQDNHH